MCSCRPVRVSSFTSALGLLWNLHTAYPALLCIIWSAAPMQACVHFGLPHIAGVAPIMPFCPCSDLYCSVVPCSTLVPGPVSVHSMQPSSRLVVSCLSCCDASGKSHKQSCTGATRPSLACQLRFKTCTDLFPEEPLLPHQGR